MGTNNENPWNVLLKFSWGHIIAFVALIAISYVIFMGFSYLNGGDFRDSTIKTIVIDVALLITFIGAQMFKGIDRKFNKWIVVERILVILCPIAFICAMVPYNHFWNVFSNKEKVEKNFSDAINEAKRLFDYYEAYANNRIMTYDHALDSVIANKTFSKYNYDECTFASADIQKKSFVETLKLQLLSKNTDFLKDEAKKWIDEASVGASVWNAFLIGNIEEIKDAIDEWNNTLIGYSDPVISNEEACVGNVEPFFDEAIASAKNGLDEVTNLYTKLSGSVSPYTVVTGIILFLCLLFPYFLQKRHTKTNGTNIRLIPKKSSRRMESSDDEFYTAQPTDEGGTESDDDDDFYGKPIK